MMVEHMKTAIKIGVVSASLLFLSCSERENSSSDRTSRNEKNISESSENEWANEGDLLNKEDVSSDDGPGNENRKIDIEENSTAYEKKGRATLPITSRENTSRSSGARGDYISGHSLREESCSRCQSYKNIRVKDVYGDGTEFTAPLAAGISNEFILTATDSSSKFVDPGMVSWKSFQYWSASLSSSDPDSERACTFFESERSDSIGHQGGSSGELFVFPSGKFGKVSAMVLDENNLVTNKLSNNVISLDVCISSCRRIKKELDADHLDCDNPIIRRTCLKDGRGKNRDCS